MISIKVIVKEPMRDKLREELERQLVNIVPRIHEDLRNATPVDTGEARDGWSVTYDIGTLTANITNSVEHVKYLNAGTSQQAPRYFIESTVLRYGNPIGTIVTYKS